MTKRVRTPPILGAVVVSFFLGVNHVFSPKGHTPPGQAALVELNPEKLEDLRQAFSAAGQPGTLGAAGVPDLKRVLAGNLLPPMRFCKARRTPR